MKLDPHLTRFSSDRLVGMWGITDAEDCILAAKSISKTHIDPHRVFIRGVSSGGYTALAAMCNVPDVFAGGASLYGISYLAKLVDDTHKFESKRMERLLGGTIQEVPEVYRDR